MKALRGKGEGGLSRAQFASVVGADEKWVENSARALGVTLGHSEENARWMRLVRMFVRDFAISLARASEFATIAVAQPVDARAFVVTTSDEGASLVLDLARFHSGYIAALSVAIEHGSEGRQVGRPARVAEASPDGFYAALQAAERYGVDLSLNREALRLTVAERLARLDENAAFLRTLRAAAAAQRASKDRA